MGTNSVCYLLRRSNAAANDRGIVWQTHLSVDFGQVSTRFGARHLRRIFRGCAADQFSTARRSNCRTWCGWDALAAHSAAEHFLSLCPPELTLLPRQARQWI